MPAIITFPVILVLLVFAREITYILRMFELQAAKFNYVFAEYIFRDSCILYELSAAVRAT